MTTPAITRVTSNLRQDIVQANVRRANDRLLLAQERLSSGLRINRPSDDPVDASLASRLEALRGRSSQFLRNVDRASTALGITDSTLSEVTDLVQRARDLALREAGDTANEATRRNAATEVGELIRNALDLANTEAVGERVFGGSLTRGIPYSAEATDVRYAGDARALQLAIGDGLSIATNLPGTEAFGSGTARRGGATNLDPGLTRATALSELLNLGTGRPEGVRPGRIVLSDGTGATAAVDLRGAKDLGDVIDRIGATGRFVASVEPASIADPLAGKRLRLDTVADPVTGVAPVLASIADLNDGTTARDLGIAVAGNATSTVRGRDLDPILTARTPLSALEPFKLAALPRPDFFIRVGSSTYTVDMDTGGPNGTAVSDVEGLLNAIRRSGAPVEAAVGATGQGVEVTSRLHGARLMVLNANDPGPTYTQLGTATDLGLFTPLGRVLLADLNRGKGVNRVQGNDLRITRRDGVSFEVDLSGATTLQDVVDLMNRADPAGAAPGAGVDASLSADGTQVVITDNSTPTIPRGALNVVDINGSFAATDLGISNRVPDGTPIPTPAIIPPLVASGRNLLFQTRPDATQEAIWGGVEGEGLFTALLRLREGLETNDETLVLLALDRIEAADRRVGQHQAEVGGRAARVDLSRNLLEGDLEAADRLATEVRGVDLAKEIVELQDQQSVFQSALGAAANILQLSLLDFLR
ncbi:MAG: hypothetical protein HY722_09285 [Planctomycetes bacterium]|nr:hypothetical protein [Planctomycetota bacterium]